MSRKGSSICSSQQCGIVLLFVLAILSMLVTAMIMLIMINRLESSLSSEKLERTQLRLTAISGIETAVARLKQSVEYTTLGEDWRYGEDITVSLEEEGIVPSFQSEPGISGKLRRAATDAVYKLKIIDSSTRININDVSDEIVELGVDRLALLIGNLARMIDEAKGTNYLPTLDFADIHTAAIGRTIVSARERVGLL